MSLDAKIEKLSIAFGRQIVEAFRESLAEEVRRAADGGSPRRGKRPGRPAGRRAIANRHTPSTCVKPGCKNPPTGPRFSFLCLEHREGASMADRKKWLAAWHHEQ